MPPILLPSYVQNSVYTALLHSRSVLTFQREPFMLHFRESPIELPLDMLHFRESPVEFCLDMPHSRESLIIVML